MRAPGAGEVDGVTVVTASGVNVELVLTVVTVTEDGGVSDCIGRLK